MNSIYANKPFRTYLTLLILVLGLTWQAPNRAYAMDEVVDAARPYTVKFIDEMTSHHRQGILMAQLAEGRAFHPELKRMASMSIAEHQKEIRDLQSIRERSYPRVERPVHRGAGMNLSRLRMQRGIDFDLAFLDSMIAHHPAAIFLGQEAMRRSGHATIRQMGQKISAKQTKELEQMRTWRDAWAGH